jgi:hypothetical protein
MDNKYVACGIRVPFFGQLVWGLDEVAVLTKPAVYMNNSTF